MGQVLLELSLASGTGALTMAADPDPCDLGCGNFDLCLVQPWQQVPQRRCGHALAAACVHVGPEHCIDVTPQVRLDSWSLPQVLDSCSGEEMTKSRTQIKLIFFDQDIIIEKFENK